MHESEHVALMRRVAYIFVTVNKLDESTADWHVANMSVSELLFTETCNGRFLKGE